MKYLNEDLCRSIAEHSKIQNLPVNTLDTDPSAVPLCPHYPHNSANTMGFPVRMSKEQITFIDSMRVLCISHQRTKTLPEFWKQIFREWFTRWPESEPTVDQLQATRNGIEGLDGMPSNAAEEHVVFDSRWQN